MNGLASAHALLVDAAARGVAPRLDATVWSDGSFWELSSCEGPPGIFDLASVTKPLSTALLALIATAEGRVKLDVPLALADGASVRQLLEHTAGYAAWEPLFRACLDDPEARAIFTNGSPRRFDRSRAVLESAIGRVRPVRPAGALTEYSDLGFLKLGLLLQEAFKARLADLFAERIAKPLGLDLAFVDLSAPARPAAESTGTLRPRPPAPGQAQALAGIALTDVGLRPGEVDDDHAYALGGAGGHAGLFGTAHDVAKLGAAFLADCFDAGKLAPPELARAWCGSPSAPRGLGWDRPSPQGSSLGAVFGQRRSQGALGAIGHLGFTGTSVWIDLDRRVVISLCTNRTRLGRENQLIRDFRPRFHDAVAEGLGFA